MSDINKCVIIGRLTNGVELRQTPSGTAVAGFAMAVNHTYTKDGDKKEEVSFINCTAWGKTAEIIAQYTSKGHRIGIEGRLNQKRWEKDGKQHSAVEIVVETFQFLQPKSGEAKPESGPGTETTGKSYDDEKEFDDNSIPF